MTDPLDIPDRQTLEKWDDAHVWHPFTPHGVYRSEEPLMIVAGEGNELIDVDGNRYLDGVASIWCNVFGHRRAEIDEAIRTQLDRIAHATFLGNASAPGVVLAKRLVDCTPSGLDKVFYSDNGSTAVEIALKMAHQYTQQVDGGSRGHRTKFMALANAYNGDTVGAVSVGGIDLFHARFGQLLFDVVRAPSPYQYRCESCDGAPGSCDACGIAAFERIFRQHASELAAVVIEPGLQGAGGMITYPPGYLERVRELTAEAGVLLIFDEVAVGMGRSGRMFACEKEGVTPDFLCIAKGLTGGYLPVAATLTSQEIFDAFLGLPEEGRTFFHGHTFTANPLGCAAALATLDIFEKESIVDTMVQKIECLTRALGSLREHPFVGDIRQYGFAAGVELVRDRGTKEPFDAALRIGMRVCRHARDRGVFLRPLGDVIVFMPPLSMTLEEIKVVVAAAEYGLQKVLSELL
jgi:adenosylmethionine---8-amino-7-oxononanoate aminotransferase